MIVGVSVAVVVLVIAAFGVFWLGVNSRISVPKLTGLSESVAQVRLAQLGLDIRVTERPFSTLPEGTVLAQRPGPNQRLNRGQTVQLSVSGGSDEFALPDVVGDTALLARTSLAERGLGVRLIEQASDQASGTVLASTPAPGSPVGTGDVVVLTVASGSSGAPDLTAFGLQGKVIIVDPVPVPTGSAGRDVTLEVGRRLQALLEASGASTQSTRSIVDAAAPEPTRAKKVADMQSSLVVILSVAKSGTGGRTVSVPSFADSVSLSESRRTAAAIAQALGAVNSPVPVTSVTPGLVMRAANGPVVGITLGSLSVAADRTDFANPQWADRVARQIYRAIGLSLAK